MRHLASRVDTIKTSPTMALDSRAKALKALGQDIISFGVGEPDFDTPAHIREAGEKAIRDGFTRYTPADGIMELKEAVCEKFNVDNGLNYSPSQIVVSNGGKHSLFNAFFSLFEAGDEVIIPAPYWVSYPDMVKLTGATPVIISTEAANRYCLTPEQLEKAITPKTKGIVINSPSNPSGMAYQADQLLGLAPLILKHRLWVISDDIYEKIIFDGFKFNNMPMVEKALYDQTVIVHGLSKTYAMTGWRMGFMAGPEKVAQAATKIQSQSTSNPCSISQKAAVAALTSPQTEISNMVASFSKRRDLILELLGQIPGLSCPKPQGAFYVFPDISSYFNLKHEHWDIKNSDDLAGYLLEKMGVAVVPGSGFGDNRSIRLSYAIGDEQIKMGLSRIKDALSLLK